MKMKYVKISTANYNHVNTGASSVQCSVRAVAGILKLCH